MKSFRNNIEWTIFGVCTYLGEKFNISISRIRLWFIYISFLTFGSPLILYFIFAFILNLRRSIASAKRNPLRWF
ncbi:MAG TPA: PspC domain-containing protein [Chitinophagaceae bacterium]|nr:PspC domain-containing protein [Chitinophagaceae bacterium]